VVNDPTRHVCRYSKQAAQAANQRSSGSGDWGGFLDSAQVQNHVLVLQHGMKHSLDSNTSPNPFVMP